MGRTRFIFKGRGEPSLSSPKPKVKSSVNRQVKSALDAVRDFLTGRSGEAKVADSANRDLRQVVAAELLAAMSPREPEETLRKSENVSGGDSPHMSPGETEQMSSDAAQPMSSGAAEAIDPSNVEATSAEQEHARQETERARQLFLDHGYFDEAVQDLRMANSSAERVAAARALGLVGSGRGTPHLIAAMFDDDPEVRSAAEEALAQIGDSAELSAPVSELLSIEKDLEELKAADASLPVQSSTLEEATSVNSQAREQEGQAEQPVGHATPAERDNRVSRSGGRPRMGRTSSKAHESVSAKSTVQEMQDAVQQASQELNQLGNVEDLTATGEEDQLLQEEQAVRDKVQQRQRQLIETAAARENLENDARARTEREARLRAEAAERIREEEELRKRAEEESERRRSQEREAMAAEQDARLKSEAEAHHLADEEKSLRLEAVNLRLAAEELACKRGDLETTRIEAAEAARRAEAEHARQDAKARHEAELERLRSEEEGLRTLIEEVALRRSQVEAAYQEAAAEIERPREEQAQLAAAEAARRAEAERLRREAEDRNRVEQEQLLFQMEELRHVAEDVALRRAEVDAAREKADEDAQQLLAAQERMRAAAEVRAQEEEERLEEEARRRKEEEQRRLAELEVARTKAEIESKQRAEKERRILSQIDSMRIADAETRKRIEEAEVRRRAAEEAYRLAAEKVQRVEAEAHLRVKEEEQILAKLEAERRTVAVEAQGRAAQEKRIKEEIELFRRLEEEERPRIEVATLQRAEAEARLQQQKDRLKAEEDARLRAEEQLNILAQYQRSAVSETEQYDEAVEGLSPVMPPVADKASMSLPEQVAAVGPEESPISLSDDAASSVPPSIAVYLNSVDPYKRAAAVAELARSHSKDAFSLIANCFDDHSPQVRNAAARALHKLEPNRSVDLFNRALEGGSAERRRNIGSAMAASGVAAEAIDNLVSESREDTYNALSILFVMAKTGEIQPLVKAIEEHPNDEISRAIIKLLILSGQSDIAEAALKRRVNGAKR